MRLLRNPITDPPQTNNPQRVTSWVSRHVRKTMLRFLEPLNIARPRRSLRVRKEPKRVNDEVNRHIRHRLRARGRGVAVHDAFLGHVFDVDPVVAGGAGGGDFAGGWEEVAVGCVSELVMGREPGGLYMSSASQRPISPPVE